MWNYLFGFRGRINRAKIWLFYLVLFGAQLLYALFLLALPDELPDEGLWQALLQPRVLAFAIPSVLLTIAVLWAYVAVVIKRLHDRNRSAWWFLIFYALPFALLLPVFIVTNGTGADPGSPAASAALIACFVPSGLLQMWGYVELYVLPGTSGDNRYGPDPLAARPD